MNYEKKVSLLRNLEILKSFGYEYCNDINLINDDINNKLPNDFNQLKNIVMNCNLCQCSKSRTNVLFGSGDENSIIMFVGNFNSTFDDEKGQYFQGNVGELFANMIEKVLLIPKESVYVTNILKCLPNSTNIDLNDINICKEYLFKQFDIISPKIIVTLGEDSFDHITNNKFEWNKVKGNIIKHNNYTILPMFHPSHILRNPTLKKDAFQDMLKLKSYISEIKID